MSSLGLGASTSVLFTHRYLLILGIMCRDRFRGRDMIRVTFSNRNVVSGSTNYVLTLQNLDVLLTLQERQVISTAKL